MECVLIEIYFLPINNIVVITTQRNLPVRYILCLLDSCRVSLSSLAQLLKHGTALHDEIPSAAPAMAKMQTSALSSPAACEHWNMLCTLHRWRPTTTTNRRL